MMAKNKAADRAEDVREFKFDPIAVRPNVAAKLMGISLPKVYELIARADFHGAFKFGACTLISVEELKDWVRRQCNEAVEMNI